MLQPTCSYVASWLQVRGKFGEKRGCFLDQIDLRLHGVFPRYLDKKAAIAETTMAV